MASTDELRAMSASILTKRVAPPQPAGVILGDEPGAAGAEAAAPAQQKVFTSFLPSHQMRGVALAGELMEIARSIGGEEGLEVALRRADEASETENLELVKYALMVFITHFPEASKLRIPSLLEREPHKLASSMAAPPDGAAADAPEAVAAAQTLSETVLNWYREDPLLNEHHERWHVVYPFSGVPDGAGGATQLRPRQGELFVYMHEQMLARYDTERMAAGLGLVEPFEDYTQVIAEGYDPGPLLSNFYTPRPDGEQWKDMTAFNDGSYVNGVYHVTDHAKHRDVIAEAMETGSFTTGAAVDPSNIGAVVESSIGSPSAVTTPPTPRPPQVMSEYGQLHNWGHLFFSSVTDPTGNTNPGVMVDTATAVRDYVFFRWHRHIDTFSFTWQETQKPNDFSDAPNVLIRKGLDGSDPANQSPDIILCFANQIPGFFNQDGSINEAAVTAFGEQHFGGDNWDKDFSSGGVTTNELLTHLYTREYKYEDQQGPTGSDPIISQETIQYLDQEEYAYFLRVQNLDNQEKTVTARIFLAAEEAAENRRLWIEMDKFAYTLGAGQSAVIGRPAAFSSVIRKPASKPPQFIPIRRSAQDEGPDNPIDYCDCGWPYNLLLPKGTAEGMPFRFMVMLTDWDLDHVPQDTTCGSMSYCGSKSEYPDQRLMGYPFNRPFKNGSIADMVAAQKNVATRDITIKFGGVAPDGGTL
jgi:tyrosinase